MRSLFIEYPRLEDGVDVVADLCNLQKVGMRIKLPIIAADINGIELKLPSFLSGVYYLKIQDGQKSFLRKIAIQ